MDFYLILLLKLIFMNMVIYQMDVIGNDSKFYTKEQYTYNLFLVVVIIIIQLLLPHQLFSDKKPVFLVKSWQTIKVPLIFVCSIDMFEYPISLEDHLLFKQLILSKKFFS